MNRGCLQSSGGTPADCKADCGLCSRAVLKCHKAVHCDSCEMWIQSVVIIQLITVFLKKRLYMRSLMRPKWLKLASPA